MNKFFTGNIAACALAIAAQEMAQETPTAAGAQVGLDVDPSMAHVFDRGSGARLAA